MAKFSKTIPGYAPTTEKSHGGDTAHDPASIFTPSTAQSITRDVESADFLEALENKKERFVPHIDFTTASNFAKFGSAKKYYEDAFTRIHNFYPYDGSGKEKINWELSSSYIDRYIFEDEYPRTTGYITVGKLTGYRYDDQPAGAPFNFYSTTTGGTTTAEYVFLKGGPNADPYGNFKLEKEPGLSTTAISKANFYNTASNRETNLKFSPGTGSTVEFWLRKTGWGGDGGNNRTETLFHLLNTGSTLGSTRGDYRIYVDSLTANISTIYVGISSGTIAHTHSLSTGLADIADSSWHHYAVINGNSGSYNYMKLYLDGKCTGVTSALGIVGELTGSLVAAIGANAGPVSNDVETTGAIGWGAVSGSSFDEFRYWKIERNAEQIGRFYLDQVKGGTNTDTANTDLGVYYKFNEGITGTASVDATVLDYSGRISNGNFVGYASGYRNTGSAMVSASVASYEFEDPIIYSTHPSVISKLADLKERGESYDYVNANALINNIPSWIIEQDANEGSENLSNMVQIVASYLDTLYLQTEALPTLKNIRYAEQKEKPFFFNQRLLSDHGFETEEILTDNSLFDYANNRDEKVLFAQKLYDVKNQIYKNIYNNLTYINKSKGTMKSFRNLLRCLGVDEEILRLSVYANGQQQDIRTNYRLASSKQKYADFYNNNNASIYINYDSSNPYSVGFISGGFNSYDPVSLSNGFYWIETAPVTVETEVVFPRYAPNIGIESNFTKEFLYYTSSIFGCYVPENLNQDSDVTTIKTDGSGSFQVYAIKNSIVESNPDVCFLLTGAFGKLTSNYFQNVYQNSKWNFAVKVKPEKSPFFPFVTGTNVSPFSLNIEFQGINTIENQVVNEFTVTSSWTDPVTTTSYVFLGDAKRLYVGANRENFTGSTVNHPSDVYISSLRYWLRDITKQELLTHAIDDQNYGTMHAYENSFLFEKDGDPFNALLAKTIEVPQMATLALNWNFDTVTGSDTSGEFNVPDFSYGTNDSRYSQLSGVLSQQYVGKAINFEASTSDVVERKNIYAYRQELPDIVYSDDQVQVVDFEGEVFTRESRPIDYFYAFEKSMYRAISEDMLNLFATMKDFHNLIGDPVNRYRTQYKNMEKIRQLFFQRASNTPDLDKFLEFYKWIDNSISNMLNNLVPATAPFADQARDVIESHVLERNKYWNKFPTIERNAPRNPDRPSSDGGTGYDEETAAMAAAVNRFNSIGSPQPAKISEVANFLVDHGSFINTPTSILGSAGQLSNPQSAQNYNSIYWRTRADITNPVIATGDSVIDTNREKIRTVLKNNMIDIDGLTNDIPTLGRVYKLFGSNLISVIGDTYNYHAGFVGETLRRGEQTTSTVKISSGSSEIDFFVADPLTTNNWNPLDPPKPRIGVGITFDSETLNGEDLLPFEIFSSSVQNGYKTALNTYFTGAELNRKFLDNYGTEVQQPMQGPFTNAHVGGSPYRHNTVLFNNPVLGDVTERSELYNLTVGTNILTLTRRSLDQVGSEYYRDEIAKRPVVFKNIKNSTGSYAGSVQQTKAIVGNYNKEYEVIQATTARSQKGWLRDNYGIGDNFTQTTAEVMFLTGNLDYNIFNRSNSNLKNVVFKDRFSAPGSPAVLSNGYLDPGTLTLSAYNCLNYRNASVRLIRNGTQFTSPAGYTYDEFRTIQTTQSLNALLRDRTIFGGYDAYTDQPSFHKIQRNPRKRLVNSGSSIVTQSFCDNGFVQHQIPQSDRQYAWITSSLEDGSSLFGYILNTSSATFLSISQGSVGGLQQDFVGMNTTYYVPINFSTHTAELKQTTTTGLNSSYGADTTNLVLIKSGFAYGFSTWRQLACHAGWATRAMLKHDNKNSIFSTIARTTVTKEKEKADIQTSTNFNLFKNEVGVVNIIDPAIIDANKSLKFTLNSVSPEGSQQIILAAPYCNNKQTFANSDVNYLAQFYDNNLDNFKDAEQDYTTMFGLYGAPGVSFVSVEYAKKIYPRTQNTFLSGTRGRLNYAEVAGIDTNGIGRRDFRTFWKDSLHKRSRADTSSSGIKAALNIFDSYITGGFTSIADQWQNGPLSVWPLDGPSTSMDSGEATARRRTSNTSSRGSLHKGPVHSECYQTTGGGPYPIINIHQAGPRYFGTDDWMAMCPVQGKAGNELNYLIDWNIGYGPWYNSYEEYAETLKRAGKNSSIIPEFNISDYMPYYMNFPTSGDFSVELPKNFLKLHGAAITSSQLGEKYNTEFFKEYSTSDFLKDFDIILNDHKSFSNISEIKLTCEGYKKLLPYNGFYPATRTAQIASLLSQSYAIHVTGVSTAPSVSISTATGHTAFTTQSSQATLQSFIQPFFAPGIMYNTIKSGIAVDWPAYSSPPTMAYPFTASAESTFISSSNDFRIQFETLYDLTRLPVDKKIYTVGNGLVNDYFTYDGNKANDLYKLAINNFLAESVNLYLKNGELTNFVSNPMSQVFFEQGNTYRMRVELEALPGTVLTRGAYANYLQDSSPWGANISLSGTLGRIFGPAVRFSDLALTNSFACFDLCDPAYAPYTPPYYYGKSVVTLNYLNDEDDTVTPTLAQIINGMSASYSCSIGNNFIPDFVDDSGVSFRSLIDANSPAIQNIMPISASVSLFGKRILEKSEYDKYGILTSMADSEDPSQFEQLVISTKYECPVLDQNLAGPRSGGAGSRGIWTQMSVSPTEKKGIVLRIVGPSDEEMKSEGIKDLRKILFGDIDSFVKKSSKKVGELPDDFEKSISEAIVAIPFLDGISFDEKLAPYLIDSPLAGGHFPASADDHIATISVDSRKFFKIFDTGDTAASSVQDLKSKLDKYVFPPSMDFINTNASPLVMFVFEFEQKLRSGDLMMMWQGVPPTCAREATKQRSSLTIPTETNELLGNFLKHCASNISDNSIITKTFNKLKWMVFKVKQRARNNYSAVTSDLSDDQRLLENQPLIGKDLPFSYNWPYDYCSLVELANITTDIKISKTGGQAAAPTPPTTPTDNTGGDY